VNDTTAPTALSTMKATVRYTTTGRLDGVVAVLVMRQHGNELQG